MNEDNKITLETFLFGGSCGEPYNTFHIDPMNSFTEFYTETMSSFKSFSDNVSTLVNDYGWDTERCQAVDLDIHAGPSVQVFVVPNYDAMKRLYLEARERMKDYEIR
jgi:hypothetical protein